jgi:tetratricopeptide (TPR) repeat protein
MAQVDRQASELLALLEKNPGDVGLMVALGNLYFDASLWNDARSWYEQALAREGGDPNVMTDLAVVYRNLKQPDKALSLLDSVAAADPKHWQALYNRVVVLHFDLHQHDEAKASLEKLERLAEENSQIPDLSRLASQVRGG